MMRRWNELNGLGWLLLLSTSMSYQLLHLNSFSGIPRAIIVKSFSILQSKTLNQLTRISSLKTRHSSQKKPLYYANIEDDDDDTIPAQQNQRFWTRSYSFHLSTLLASQSVALSVTSTITPAELVTVIVGTLQMKQQQEQDNETNASQTKVVIPKCDSGLAIVTFRATTSTALPGDTFSCNLIVPIHNAVLQTQHAFLSRDGENLSSKSPSPAALSSSDVRIPVALQTDPASPRDISFLICGFFPRAQHVIQGPNEYERPVDLERLAALDAALLNTTSTSAQELLSAKLAGTPPARIYRSFVSPRQNRTHLLESVDRAAVRTAAQIELALRRIRADEAAYLRNTDRSLDLSGQLSPAAPEVYVNQSDGLAEEGGEGGSGSGGGGGKNPVVLVLDNLRSAFNVGSIFRSAETAGVSEIITCGICPHPPHPKLRKTAFSALDAVRSRHVEEVLSAVTRLKEEGYCVVVMETTSRSQRYTKVVYPRKLALVVGNEITGVDPRVMEVADIIAEIPTFGVKNSLNVASALPIVLFEVLRQWEP